MNIDYHNKVTIKNSYYFKFIILKFKYLNKI